ncbi:hypothetical protein [Modestobacter lapidis]|nr:hypothetical protein [Modestobacter lapidis]
MANTGARPIRSVLFPTDPAERVRTVSVDGSTAGLCQALDAWSLDHILMPGLPRTTLVRDAKGKAHQGTTNTRATQFVERYVRGFSRSGSIVGPALLVGSTDSDWTNISPAAEQAALTEQPHLGLGARRRG